MIVKFKNQDIYCCFLSDIPLLKNLGIDFKELPYNHGIISFRGSPVSIISINDADLDLVKLTGIYYNDYELDYDIDL